MVITTKPLNILIVEDDFVDQKAISRYIQSLLPNAKLNIAENIETAKIMFDPELTNFVMIDYMLPDGTGLEMIEHILKVSTFIPIVFLTGFGDEELAVKALQLGACDYINKDSLEPARVKQAIENSIERRHVEKRIYDLAHYDPLTHLYNRAHFESRMHLAIKRTERYAKNMAIMFMDLDGFKQVNDKYGHAIGDLVLKEAAQRLKSSVRDIDTVARFGGDEFAVILEELEGDNKGSCAVIGHRIIDAIRRPFEIQGHALHIGISIGVAIHSGSHEYPESLLKMADEAMYEAKRNDDMKRLKFSE